MSRNSICTAALLTCLLAAGSLHAQSKHESAAAIIKRWGQSVDTLRFTSDTVEKELTYENYQCDTVWVTTSFEFGDRGFSIDGDTAVQGVCGGEKLSFLVQHDPQHSALPESDRLIVKFRERTFDTTSRVELEAAAPSAAVETGYASEGGALAGWIADGLEEIKVLPPQPNPSRVRLNLSYAIRASHEVTFAIFSESGRRMLTTSIVEEAGIHDTPLDVHTLPSGNYLLQITAGTSTRTFKIVVE